MSDKKISFRKSMSGYNKTDVNSYIEQMSIKHNDAEADYQKKITELENKIKELEAKPVFAVLEPVTIPIRKAAPSKAKLLVVFCFLGFCCSAAWVLFGKNFWNRIKEVISK